ncbi:rhodanese-like domain-containing protein [Haloparvum sp. PAK95]|uniref:rhodanese-like domain-containing protein n=1 Tax=Haloparvum sp. PAK95 TaxID=3418962 RepID=UPI003D2EEB6D
MKRRPFLAAAATGLAGAVAGCSGSSSTDSGDTTPTATDASGSSTSTESSGNEAPFEHTGTLDASFVANGDYPADENPADGFPPEFPDPPAAPDVDESEFDTVGANGEAITLVPIDVAEKWFYRSEARFVDARGVPQYEHAHVYGSVLSTAQRESDGGGIDGWDKSDRVVTYCGCPHHLSSLRAAGLKKAGFENVYAIDEGFGEWSARGNPMSGTSFGDGDQESISEWVLEGSVGASYAGEYVWAEAARQYEAAPIRADGSFEVTLKFSGVTEETPVSVSTPAFATTAPLGELADGAITGSD